MKPPAFAPYTFAIAGLLLLADARQAPQPAPIRESRSVIVCSALKALHGRDEDAGPVIRDCIKSAREGDIVELPPGKYRISTRVLFERGYTVRTQGKTTDMPKCDYNNAPDCAELIATPALESAIFGLTGIGGAIDHLVINGNKSERKARLGAKGCTFPMRNGGLDCTECTMTNSVSKNAFCGPGLQLGVDGNNLLISRNTFAFNGIHTSDGIWADGLTALQIHNSSIVDNDFIDNTDVDLVMGGCPDCRVRNNRIVHTNDPRGASFAALIVHAWPASSTSGDYTGADISNNSIDCGMAKHCGFGLLVGADPWYQAPTFGGSIHHNRIRNAMQGVNVDHTTGMVEFYDNFAEQSGGEVVVACGNRMTTAYNIAPGSVLDRSRDSIPTSAYSNQDWDGCVISPTVGRRDERKQ